MINITNNTIMTSIFIIFITMCLSLIKINDNIISQNTDLSPIEENMLCTIKNDPDLRKYFYELCLVHISTSTVTGNRYCKDAAIELSIIRYCESPDREFNEKLPEKKLDIGTE